MAAIAQHPWAKAMYDRDIVLLRAAEMDALSKWLSCSLLFPNAAGPINPPMAPRLTTPRSASSRPHPAPSRPSNRATKQRVAMERRPSPLLHSFLRTRSPQCRAAQRSRLTRPTPRADRCLALGRIEHQHDLRPPCPRSTAAYTKPNRALRPRTMQKSTYTSRVAPVPLQLVPYL
ncbi:hypothetical protein BS50DRAFT_365345 [Corynespora cassiicola Philippines]|uniref:Uncharacterized protein n=1 Tax=Corynespora cassiicola Philippines TaxID=1448308 RepID=A0A2T2NSP5_CORCC|nr:hypothetical protein BS50DRAFT_365345 [Corynespora cassiicola Philippines]